MFKRFLAVFVAVVVLVTGSPAIAQTSDLLASATSSVALMTQEAEQEQTFVRRRRSGGLAWIGGVLAVAGTVLALRPPNCELNGPTRGTRYTWWGGDSTLTYSAVRQGNECAVKVRDDNDVGLYFLYSTDNQGGYDDELTPDDGVTRTVTTKKTLNQVGWATVAAGGVLLGIGLSSVDVPVRVDIAPGGVFRVARSLGW